MPTRSVFRRPAPADLAICIALSAALACVEFPLEHTNYYDPNASTRLEIVSVPDTMNSIDEAFVAQIVSVPAVPASAPPPNWSLVEGSEVLSQLALGEFRAASTAGIIAVKVRLRVTVGSSPTPPTAERVVVVRQRPVSALLRCDDGEGCASVVGLLQERLLAFELRDSLNYRVNLPAGSFRYGTVLSRSPSIVSVVARPTAAGVQVRTEAAGAAWIVFLGGGGVADSLLVNVTP
mgnify:CR=1 FL=1